jgi:hypothetical protein
MGSERRDVNDFRGDYWSVVTSPVHADRGTIAPLTAVAGVVVASSFADSAVYAWMVSHPDAPLMRALVPMRENWKLPIYELGSGQYLLPLSGIAYVAGRLSHSKGLRDAGIGCMAGHLSSATLRYVTYFSVSRVRPHDSPTAKQISFPGTRDWMHHSFVGGHMANSMACASFLGHRYSLGVVEPITYAYVSAIGLGRMADGWHWFSDTMAGAGMGFAIGKLIAERQERRAEDLAAVAPASGRPIRIGVTFTF